MISYASYPGHRPGSDITKRRTIIAGAAVMLAAPAFGHHSDAALQMDRVMTVEGTVVEFSMRNPHTYFTVERTNEAGEIEQWDVQMGSAISVTRRGWSRDTLLEGDQVTVGLHPARDGRTYGLFAWVEQDGVPMAYERNRTQPTDATTTTLQGRWIVDRESLGPDYPGGLDQLMRRDLILTEKGRLAYETFDQDSAENPELACKTKPTPGGLIYTDMYPMEIEFIDDEDLVMIRVQYFDQERTVYMDGREHPPADERTHEGHSIGWWEDDVLVVDTANFADDRSPYQNGTPSGAQKHVVERYRLHADGRRLTLEFTLEDPEYIVGTMTHTRELLYSPHLEWVPFNCDLDSTSRYLPD